MIKSRIRKALSVAKVWMTRPRPVNQGSAAWYYAQGWADHERLVCLKDHHTV